MALFRVEQTVAVAVFSGISFSFYVFFIPFAGGRVLRFHIYAIFSPVVSYDFRLCIPNQLVLTVMGLY